MGYYSTYEFGFIFDDWADEAELMDKFEAKFHEVTRFEFQSTLSEIKWNECKNDMIEISECFPDMTIVVNVKGEEFDDIWRGIFRNGKSLRQMAKIAFDPWFLKDLK